MSTLFLDLETTGLDWKKDKIVLGGFKYGDRLWTESPPFSEQVKGYLRDEETEKVGHNVGFDILFLLEALYEVEGVFIDTRTLLFQFFPTHKLKLKELAKTLLGKTVVELKSIVPKKILVCSDNHKHINKCYRVGTTADIDKDILSAYCLQDVKFCSELKEMFYPGASDWFKNIEQPLTKIVVIMSRRGMFLDIGKIKELHTQYRDSLTDIQAKFPETNLNSPLQVKNFLKTSVNIKVKTTEKTNLMEIKNEIPEVQAILSFRECSKLSGTYTSNFLANSIDNKIFSNFNQVGTKTGRFSSSKPNLQNIPNRTEEGKKIRKCFIAPPGMKMLVGDASQIEPRLVAFWTKDKILSELFQSNQDFHGLVTQIAYNKCNYTAGERFVGKTIGLATLYGAQTTKLQAELRKYGVSLTFSEVDTLRNSIEKYFVSVRQWIGTYESSVEYTKKIVTYGGREIPFTPDMSAFNTLIQGSCADYLKICLLNLESMGHEVVNVVHDEIIEYVKENEIRTKQEEVQYVMERSISLYPIPVKADVMILDSWGEK